MGLQMMRFPECFLCFTMEISTGSRKLVLFTSGLFQDFLIFSLPTVGLVPTKAFRNAQ